ncbi:hypothetical protein [Methylobacterium soli]|uniref:Uncharacterized protein n=1 Tax=Methylobacterium soli TaxID=553447 RepID=A0A6L3SPP9_9HYPH|nr:hypothetical protein [Methylobacterium soli]KAB1070252.1 hypothetical protein F6X53_30210 [Methylobacterium soli]GJE46032.1 hypothetical protein AEGHOMDF_5232 [Methylobacterium soli]
MNIGVSLALQSIPFAILFFATNAPHRDLFLVAYTAALGLVLSLIVLADGAHMVLPVPGMTNDPHR